MNRIYFSSKILTKYLQIVSLIIVLSTILIVDRDLVNATVSSKQFWFYIAIGIVSISTVLLYYTNKNKLQFSLIDGLIILFIFSATLMQFYQHGEIRSKLLIFILIGVLYFYFRITFAIWRHAEDYLLLFLVFTGLVEAVWGFGQLYGMFPSFNSTFKITGSFYNPGPYSGYLAIMTPVALYSMLKDTSKVLQKNWDMELSFYYLRWIVSMLTLSLIITILPATMSRASWFATAGGCLFVLSYYLWNDKREYLHGIKLFIQKHRILSVFIIISFFTLIVVLIISSYYLKQDSADGRLFMWKISLLAILKNPMGVGLGYFSGAYGESQADYFASGLGTVREEYLAGCPEYAFNEFLQIAVEFGVWGIVLFFLLVVVSVYSIIHSGKYWIAGSLLSLLIFALLSYPFNLLPFLIVLAFLLSQAGGEGLKLKKCFNCIPVILLACFLIVAGCLYNRYPVYGAYKAWSDAKCLYNARIYKGALDIYEEAEPYLFDQAAFLFEYAGCLSSSGEYDRSNQILQQAAKKTCDPIIFIRMGTNYQLMKNFIRAEFCYKKAISIIPSRQYPYYLLAKLYVETTESEKAVNMAELCLDRQPKIDSQAVLQIKKEMREILDLLDAGD